MNISESPWLKSNKDILIYGTGTVGKEVWQVLTAKGVTITAYMDHRTREKPFLNGMPILPAGFAIHNREANMPALIDRLKALGYRPFTTMIDLYDQFAAEFGQYYWLAPRNFYAKYIEEIRLTQNLFADKASRDLFNSLLNFRKTGDYSILPTPDIEHQYFPPDVPAWERPIRFVDCGAFDGDTLQGFEKLNIPLEAVVAFEPDQNNFQKLSKYIRKNKIPNAFLWPCGVYSSATQLRFSTGQGEASVISENGTAIIQCVSLDEAIPNFKPTLIKMDIEGAEMEAIKGAQNIIQKNKPGLAISVYHLPQHIWGIPLLIKKMTPKAYHYYLRAHGFNDFDIVLYAIPI